MTCRARSRLGFGYKLEFFRSVSKNKGRWAPSPFPLRLNRIRFDFIKRLLFKWLYVIFESMPSLKIISVLEILLSDFLSLVILKLARASSSSFCLEKPTV